MIRPNLKHIFQLPTHNITLFCNFPDQHYNSIQIKTRRTLRRIQLEQNQRHFETDNVSVLRKGIHREQNGTRTIGALIHILDDISIVAVPRQCRSPVFRSESGLGGETRIGPHFGARFQFRGGQYRGHYLLFLHRCVLRGVHCYRYVKFLYVIYTL